MCNRQIQDVLGVYVPDLVRDDGEYLFVGQAFEQTRI